MTLVVVVLPLITEDVSVVETSVFPGSEASVVVSLSAPDNVVVTLPFTDVVRSV